MLPSASSSSSSSSVSKASPSSSWTFTFPANSRCSTQPLENPIGYKPLSDEALADEVAEASVQASAFSCRSDESTVESRRNARRVIGAIREKAWNLTWSPIKSLGMNLLMLYFGGGDPGIFTVLIISYALLNAFKTLLSVNYVFQELEDAVAVTADGGANSSSTRNAQLEGDVDSSSKMERHPLAKFFLSPFVLQKIVFVTICSTITSYILYHAAAMGIIPWRSGDFLSLIPERKVVDRAIGMF